MQLWDEDCLASLVVQIYYLDWNGWGPEDTPGSFGCALGHGSRAFLNLRLLGERDLEEDEKAKIVGTLWPLIRQHASELLGIPFLVVGSQHVSAFLGQRLKNVSRDPVFRVYPVLTTFDFNIGPDHFSLSRNGGQLSLYILEGKKWCLVRK